MTEGLLEVLLVKAQGIQHKNHLGTRERLFRVICSFDESRFMDDDRAGKGNKVWWNEKLSYELPINEWKHATHLNLKIMNLRFLGGGVCVGQTTPDHCVFMKKPRIYLGGMVEDWLERDPTQEVRPSPYNVVLEDGTYRGEVVVGLRFTVTDAKRDTEPDGNRDPTKPPWPWSSRTSTWKIWWWKLLYSFSKRIARDNKRFDCNNQLVHP
ncbi:hypothetical protein MLD38_039011 [Melastoma candidum]|uniref:Uncharacterized protein n=1 Tax=Melastoma candidum TaxID=119954 RepID=A0ACB9L0Q5_9MYRT|nr:hypothetical protein MLD38_039011 [Melastoma candidum]